MLFNRLSNPFEGDFVVLAEKLTVKVVQGIFNLVNETISEDKQVKLDQDISPSVSLWRPEFGTIVLVLQKDKDIDFAMQTWLNAQLRIGLFLAGELITVSLDIYNIKHPLTIAGSRFTAEKLKIEGQGNNLSINHDGEVDEFKKTNLNLISPTWENITNNKGVVKLGQYGAAIITITDWLSDWSPDTPLNDISHNYEGFAEQVSSTFDFLFENLPEFYVWCASMIRELVPLIQEHPTGTSSRSFTYWPGQVHLSTPGSLLQTISMLVHECSHQYFHAAKWSCYLVKEGAPECYSVLKQVYRPLEMVLLGYHAFANVLCAFKSLVGNEAVDQEELAGQIRHVSNYVNSLQNQLETNLDWLTESGKEFYYPLRRLIKASENLAAIV